jgi:outer membrane protein OmpA-like peptidoglycan-associated protein
VSTAAWPANRRALEGALEGYARAYRLQAALVWAPRLLAAGLALAQDEKGKIIDLIERVEPIGGKQVGLQLKETAEEVRIELAADVLFEFDKADLRPDGQKKLDEVADRVKGANVQQVNAIGHADRIGSDDYNQKLSEKRAEAVKDYLASKGIGKDVRAEGRGEAEPVTGEQCKGMSGQKLKACLQPDRRVDIEVRGSRQVAAGEAPAASGSTAGGSAGSSSSSSSSASGAASSRRCVRSRRGWRAHPTRPRSWRSSAGR